MAIILNDEIILGSGSETRLELLKRHGLNINNFAPTVDEEQLKNEHCQDMGPNEMALFLAKAKAIINGLKIKLLFKNNLDK